MKAVLISMACICLCVSYCPGQHPGAIPLATAKFHTGDDPSWRQPVLDETGWGDLRTGNVWQAQGYPDYHGFAWYRIHVKIPASLKDGGKWKDSLRIFLAHVNDVDETWLNGVKIGKTGAFPGDPGGYVSKWPAVREYHVAIDNPAIKWDQDNVIAIRDYDGGGTGGIFMGEPYLDMLERTDGLRLSDSGLQLQLMNRFHTVVRGKLRYVIYDADADKELSVHEEQLTVGAFEQKEFVIPAPARAGIRCRYSFEEDGTGSSLEGHLDVPYILTPPPAATPHINGAKVFGVRPGNPLLYRIAATGQKPLQYAADGLPEGLKLDPVSGIISGTIHKRGKYTITVTVGNSIGKERRQLVFQAGDLLALTPPMGWNSWNCWGLSVSDEKVRSSAQALIDKGLVEHGWSYINIDDGWQAPMRKADSTMIPNEKFPDMRSLGDWLHGKGLKFGIYSSPGPRTCGGYLGSYRHETRDADLYGTWGIDYLKYDWCSYDGIVKDDTSLEAFVKPYRLMQGALRRQKRDIVYSLCQYGLKDVWKWGPRVDGQSWRTTEDIEDTWASMREIGFRQDALYPYARPGNWNDPDMMIVGQVGWGENLHASRLTPDEQYTHVSLWCLLSAPLLIGCDLSRLDPFTLNLLTNDEVLAIDQDPLGRQARRLVKDDQHEIWVKELSEGRKAIGVFNMDTVYRNVLVDFGALELPSKCGFRDPWTQQDLGWFDNFYNVRVAPHGVQLLIVK